MKINVRMVLMIVFVISMYSFKLPANKQVENRTISFDNGWRFINANPSGAEAPAF